MTKADDHAEEMVTAYLKYRERRQGIEQFEKDMLERTKGNRLLASVEIRDQEFYRLAAGSRNSFQEQIRTEAAMAIVGLLMEIRSLLRELKRQK